MLQQSAPQAIPGAGQVVRGFFFLLCFLRLANVGSGARVSPNNPPATARRFQVTDRVKESNRRASMDILAVKHSQRVSDRIQAALLNHP